MYLSIEKSGGKLAEAMAYSDLTDKIKAGVSALNEVILAIPDSELSAEVSMPWGTQTVADISAYSFQNSCYHLGQINYIAMMNGVTIP